MTTEAARPASLREAADRLEASPTKAEYEDLGLTPASATIIRQLGGWNAAKEAAGLETNPSTGSRTMPEPDDVELPEGRHWGGTVGGSAVAPPQPRTEHGTEPAPPGGNPRVAQRAEARCRMFGVWDNRPGVSRLSSPEHGEQIDVGRTDGHVRLRNGRDRNRDGELRGTVCQLPPDGTLATPDHGSNGVDRPAETANERLFVL